MFMKYLYSLTVLILFLISFGSSAQVIEKTHSPVFITPKIGVTFSDADISTRYNWGVGLDLGATAFKYRKVEFDIRASFLVGSWKGQNYRNSYLGDYQGSDEQLLNDALLDYKNKLGYVVRNYRAINAQLALDGIFRFNVDPLRRFFPYILGGVGVSIYGVKSDMYDSNGDIYNYQPNFIPSSKSYYTKLQDNKYESSMLFGNSDFALTGNLGVGIGYNVNDGLRIGIEHKISFLNKDNFDGYKADKKAFRNDLYHFTSIYFQIYLGRRTHHTDDKQPNPVQPTPSHPTQPTQPTQPTPNPSQPTNNQTQTPCNQPSVDFVDPSTNGLTTTESYFTFNAFIREINNRNSITVTYNGSTTMNYKFNDKNDRFSAYLPLKQGANNLTITVYNECGQASATTTVIYQQPTQPETPKCDDPIVTIHQTQDGRSPNLDTQKTITGSVQNISNKNQITVYVNGQQTQNFTYNPYVQTFSITVQPIRGQNTIAVYATNNCGTGQQTSNFTYTIQNPPTVNFTSPSQPGLVVTESQYTFIAKTNHISSKNQIHIEYNGSGITDFTFNANTKEIRFNRTLSEGNNTSKINVQNEDGSDMTLTNIIYQPKRVVNCDLPKIVISTTNEPLRILSSEYQKSVEGFIYNVLSKDQINIFINGQKATNFSFNPVSHAFKVSFQANAGNNTVKIVATNPCGTDETSTNVDVTVKNPPTVNFTIPANTGTTTNQPAYSFVAITTNITSSNQVTVTLNGNSITNFTFLPNTKQVKFNATLVQGNNTAQITVQNNDGSDNTTTNILYRPDEPPCNTPVIAFVTRHSDQMSSTPTGADRSVEGFVTNVSSKNQISIFINGQMTTFFTFEPATGAFKLNFTMASQGNTNIKVVAKNECGSDQKETNFTPSIGTGGNTTGQNYSGGDRGNLPKPTVNFTQPSANGTKTNHSTYHFIANTTNVSTPRQIKVTFNGTPINDYIYNPVNGQISFDKNLINGNNTAEIIITHPTDPATDNTSIVFEEKVISTITLPPTVKWISPSKNGEKSITNTFNFEAKTFAVDNKNQLRITFNSVSVNDFSFNASSGTVTFNRALRKGNNIVFIQATVNGKTATAQTSVNYSPVTINNPIKTPITTVVSAPVIFITSHSCPIELALGNNLISGYITNISNTSQANFSIDGKKIQGLTTSLKDGNLQFSFRMVARTDEAPKTLSITANNGKGASKKCVINSPQSLKINIDNSIKGNRPKPQNNVDEDTNSKKPPIRSQNGSSHQKGNFRGGR